MPEQFCHHLSGMKTHKHSQEYSRIKYYFRLFYYFARCIHWLKSCRRVRRPSSAARTPDRRVQYYWATLTRLMDSKLNADFESSPQDDFIDLRVDTRNTIINQMKLLKKEIENLRKLVSVRTGDEQNMT